MARVVIRSWRPQAVREATRDEMVRRMTRATLLVQDRAVRLVNRGNPTGLNPSKPGQPPKKVTGGLQGRMAQQVVTGRDEVTGYVGNNADHARRLELGFMGTDRLGRVYDQAPRPYLRPALASSAKALARLLGAG